MDDDATREGPKRVRPRSFVGGGNVEFTYDKHHGGIRDFGEPSESEGKKKKRPRSLYEMFSKDMLTGREHSKPDGTKPLARLSSQEKVDEINNDRHKVPELCQLR